MSVITSADNVREKTARKNSKRVVARWSGDGLGGEQSDSGRPEGVGTDTIA